MFRTRGAMVTAMVMVMATVIDSKLRDSLPLSLHDLETATVHFPR